MESDHFDQIIRSLTVRSSRRGLAALLTGALAAYGLKTTSATAAKAKNQKKKCKKPCADCEVGGDDCPGLCFCQQLRSSGTCLSPVGTVVERCDDCPPGTVICQDAGVVTCFPKCEA